MSSCLPGFTNSEKVCDKEFIIRRAATNRVLNVLRHWVSKHSQVSPRRVKSSTSSEPSYKFLNRCLDASITWRGHFEPTWQSVFIAITPPLCACPLLSLFFPDGGALYSACLFSHPGSMQKGQRPPRGHWKDYRFHLRLYKMLFLYLDVCRPEKWTFIIYYLDLLMTTGLGPCGR